MHQYNLVPQQPRFQTTGTLPVAAQPGHVVSTNAGQPRFGSTGPAGSPQTAVQTQTWPQQQPQSVQLPAQPHLIHHPMLRRPAAGPAVAPSVVSPAWAQVQRATSRVFGPMVSDAALKTFYCPICLENHSVAERVCLSACGHEDHGICKDTMASYIKGAVNDGRIVKCHQCSALATDDEVLRFTDDATYQKYVRFRRMREDPELRECPSCAKLCKPDVIDGEVQPEMTCQCGEEFCYYHSNAHPGQSCEEYRLRQTKEERVSEKGALRGTKKCPNPACQIRTEKTSGCNHMTCSRCDTHWCWICEKAIDRGANGVTDHYSMGGQCGGRLFEDINPGSPFYYILPVVVFPVKIISFVLFIVTFMIAVALYPIFFIVMMPLHRCKCASDTFRSVWLGALMVASVPFIIFLILWSLFAGGLWLILYYCGAGIEHVIYLIRAPVDAVAPVVMCCRSCWKRCCGRRIQDSSSESPDGEFLEEFDDGTSSEDT